MLFVAGNETNSIQARKNLQSICEDYLSGQYEINVINVLDNIKIARQYGIFALPTLSLAATIPKTIILGRLSDEKKILASMRIIGVEI